MALKPVGSKGLLTLNGVDLVKFVPEMEAIQVATDNAIGNGDATTLQAAGTDATTKANTAETNAVATAKTYTDQRDEDYRTVDRALWRQEDDGHEAAAKTYSDKLTGASYVVNGSFRDGFTGWANTGAWIVETSTATSWARAMSGSDGALTQSITLPAHLLGKTLRLKVLAMTTSTGTLQTKVTTVSGDTQLQHTLATGAYQEKTLDVLIPAGQGTTPITLAVGRWSGNVYMTAIRLEAL